VFPAAPPGMPNVEDVTIWCWQAGALLRNYLATHYWGEGVVEQAQAWSEAFLAGLLDEPPPLISDDTDSS
jgi:hypothetical protein